MLGSGELLMYSHSLKYRATDTSYQNSLLYCVEVVLPSLVVIVSEQNNRKAYLAMTGVVDHKLIQFVTGSNRQQDGHRVHVVNFHLP